MKNEKEDKAFYKLLTVAIALVIVLICAARLREFKPFQVQKLLREDHPIRKSYEQFNEKYNDEDKVYILLSGTAPLDFNKIGKTVLLLSDNLERTRGINSVSHINKAKYITYEDARFTLQPFLENNKFTDLAKERLETAFWKNNLISQDKKSLLLTITLSSKIQRSKRIQVVSRIEELTKSAIADHQDIKANFIGTEVANFWFTKEMIASALKITPLLFSIFGLFLFIIFRSFKSVLLSFTVITMAYASTGILISLLENGIGPYSNFALFFVIIVSTSDLIHFFIQYKLSDSDLKKTIDAIKTPCLLTSITTAIGFSSLLINENVPLIYLGIYSIFGTFIAYTLTFYYIPLAITAFDIKLSKAKRPENISKRLWHFISNHYRKVFLIFTTFILFLAYQSIDQKIDDNTYNKFNKHHPLTKSITTFKNALGFVGSVDIIIKKKNGDITSPKSIKQIKEFEKNLLDLPTTTHHKSFTQFYDNMSTELGSDLSKNRLESLFNLLYNYGALNSLYKLSSNEIRTTLFLESLNSTVLEKTIKDINLLKLNYPEFNIDVNGFAAIRNYIGQNVIKNFIRSMALTFILIALVFLFLFKSMKWSLLAMIPNIFPLLLISGLMGYFEVPIDNNLLILISITLGISVDDTIHFIYKLRKNMSHKPLDLAVQETVNTTLLPLLSTTGIFILCFPSFLLSEVVLFEQVGMFLMLSLLMAFLSDFLFLPSLLLMLNKGKKQ